VDLIANAPNPAGAATPPTLIAVAALHFL